MARIPLPMNQMDFIVRHAMQLSGSEFFTQSWGPPELLKTLRVHQANYPHKGALIEVIERRMPKMVIEKQWLKDGVQFMEGWFQSPLETILPSAFECGPGLTRAAWRGIFPAPDRPRNGIVINLAATGDQGYWRRENFLANQLVKQHGISSILLTNPFYGSRRPQMQTYSRLLNVTDLFVMGGCLMLECCFLLIWAQQQDFHPMGLTGVSMGGHMASLAATNFHEKPIALIPCLSWTSAAPVFTQGLLARSVNWEVLSNELESNCSLRHTLDECGWIALMEDKEHTAYKLFPNSPARRLMWILMEEFTNLRHYPPPRTQLGSLNFVVAEKDEYVPKNEYVPDARDLWKDAQIHVVPDAGHVWAFMGHHALFRETIVNSMIALGGHQYVTSIPRPINDNETASPLNPLWRYWNRFGVTNNVRPVRGNETKQTQQQSQKL